MKTLDELALKYGTDKSSAIHNYAVKYEKYLPFDRDQDIKILEIGVLNGNSLHMWRGWFPKARITGIDINPICADLILPDIKVLIGSQTDVLFMTDTMVSQGPFDLVVDDGSHKNSDVIKTFTMLFPGMNHGGVYVVEDSCTSYWPKYGGGTNSGATTMEFFKKLTDDVSFRGIQAPGAKPSVSRREEVLLPWAQRWMIDCWTSIENITFLNSLILITKR